MAQDVGMSEPRRSDPVTNPNPLCGTDWGRLLEDEFAQPYWAVTHDVNRRWVVTADTQAIANTIQKAIGGEVQ